MEVISERARMVDQCSGNQRPRVADATSRVDRRRETGTLPLSASPELDRLSTISSSSDPTSVPRVECQPI